jgi:hypothetical protein
MLFINLIQEKGDATMKGKLLSTVMLGLLFCSFLASPAFARGIEPVPWHKQVNRLESVKHGLDSIMRRLAEVLTSPERFKLKKSAHEGVIGRLEAMANQLDLLNDRIVAAMSGVPMKPLPPEIKIVLMDIHRDAMETAKIARMGIGDKIEGVRKAFTKVQMAAEMTIFTMKDWMMNPIYVFQPFNETSCVIGYPCDITWDTSNIQNYPFLWLEVVNADGSDCCGAFPGIPNTGYYYGFIPDPSWADPGVLCQPFRIKIFVDPNTNDYSGVSGLFKVGIYPLGCTW